MSVSSVRRRDFLTLLAGSTVAGCVPFAETSPFWGTISAGIKGGPKSAPAISREYADSLPYASMLSWFEGAAKALLVLAEIAPGNRYTWYSAERQSIGTFGPFLTSAIGFDLELRATRFQGAWQSNPLSLTGRKLQRLQDFVVEGQRYQLLLESRFAADGFESVAIMGREYRLRAVREHVSYQGRRRFTNHYWVDEAKGRCWKSRQIVVPTMPELNIEMLKHPSA